MQTSIIIARLIGPLFATIGVGMLVNTETYRQIGQQFLSTYAILYLSGIFLLLFKCFDSWRAALQVMVNIPLAAIGSVIALLITSWPGLAAFAEASFWRWPLVWLDEATARKFGLEAVVLEDACRAIDNAGSLDAAWAAMKKAGVKRGNSSTVLR